VNGPAERFVDRMVEAAVARAVVGRRGVLRGVGGSELLSAIGAFFPVTTAKVLAQEARGALEKKELRIGFVPIACATPVIMAEPMGFYAMQGLQVVLVKTPGWALIRDMVLNRQFDASHMLSPMPLAMSLGLPSGSGREPTRVAAIESGNGQALTLHSRHKDNRDPRKWKGMKLAVPFEYSMQDLLLRYYLAEHGLDPDADVELRVIPPPEMVASLKTGSIDGYLGPEPFNQRAVHEEIGFIHLRSKDLWDGHPCCALGVSDSFVKENPNTFAALFRAIASAAAHAHVPENRKEIAKAIAPASYLNQPVPVLEQVLIGRSAGFDPFPWHSMAVWILTQLKRWGYVKGDLDYRAVAEQVFLASGARERMRELGLPAPEKTYAQHQVMGKTFDPARPEEYLNGFAIRRRIHP